jgi:hypothetical protein
MDHSPINQNFELNKSRQIFHHSTLQASQGYIIRILQHFATKLWNITNFVMLFQAVMKFLFRLVKIKILEKW